MEVKILKYAQALYTKRKGAKTRRREDLGIQSCSVVLCVFSVVLCVIY